MNRAILSNLGFEYELAGRPVRGPVRKQEARFAWILRLVEGWREATLLTQESAELLPWGMSARARRAAPSASRNWPSEAVVRRANDKRFSHELERELGVALPGARVISSIEQLPAAQHRWLLKHPFGVAGRDVVRASREGPELAVGSARLLETVDELVAEPIVEIDREYSVHYQLLPAGDVIFVGATQLLADAVGTFRGNATGVAVPEQIRQITHHAAEELARVGYHGPVGFDAFVGELDGAPIVRPICEINARWSFGRLALELARWFGGDVKWHHGRAADRPEKLLPLERGCGGGMWILPDWCDPNGTSGTWVEVTEIAESPSVC